MAQEFINTPLYGSDTNLKGYWRLEDVNATYGTFTLTNVGTVTFTAGQFGSAADTGATNLTKKLTNNNNIGISGGICTINGWFNSYASTFIGDHPPLISLLSDQTGGAGVAYVVGIDTTGVFASRLKSGIAWQSTSSVAISASTWYMTTLTYDGTNVHLFLNGTFQGSAAASGTGLTGYYPDQICFFSHAGYTADAFTSAKLDDVTVFNRVLAGTEITNLYVGWPSTKNYRNLLGVGF